MKRILITGGAGFVGSSLGVLFRQHDPGVEVMAVDNLMRRGSELNLPRLKEHGVRFRHADIRQAEDLQDLGDFDLLVDCAAEPSVHSGTTGGPRKVLNINLAGTINLMELARERNASVLYLSTSRVYPIETINALAKRDNATRFQWVDQQPVVGASASGIAETFPLDGARTFYGASKLCSELLIEEYVHAYGIKAIINRCGVLAGPWQMGKVDQGVVSLWVAAHVFERSLQYKGYGGTGHQVRDILHVDDLFALILKQLACSEEWACERYNVGGGVDISVSLCELTQICRETTGKEVVITPDPKTSPVDIPLYISDTRKVSDAYSWEPKRRPVEIVEEITRWVTDHREALRFVFSA